MDSFIRPAKPDIYQLSEETLPQEVYRQALAEERILWRNAGGRASDTPFLFFPFSESRAY